MGFLDSLFGFDDARDDIRTGQTEANALTAAGLDTFNTQADQAISTLAPGVAAGDAGQNELLALLGLSGQGAEDAAFDTLNRFNDRFQSGGVEAIDQSAAARGGLFSGGTLKSLHQFGQREKFSQFQDRLNRLTGLSGVGTVARAGTAQIELDKGSAAFGESQLQANNAINTSTALSSTRGGGLNALLKIGTEAAKAASGFA